MKNLVKSPQTTVAAVVILVGAAFQFGLVPVFDGIEETVINWQALSGAAVIFYGFWKSRDQKQHEKDVGEV